MQPDAGGKRRMTEVTLEVDGRTYTGRVTIEDGIVNVNTIGGWTATQIGESPPEVVARMLLRELVQAERARKDSML